MTFTCKSGKFFENYVVNCRFTLSFIYRLSQRSQRKSKPPSLVDRRRRVARRNAIADRLKGDSGRAQRLRKLGFRDIGRRQHERIEEVPCVRAGEEVADRGASAMPF